MEIYISKNAATYPNHKHWQFCVGSGHALLALRTDYTRQLKKVHDELGIRYVRFHGIFADDMSTYTTLRQMLPFPGTEAFKEINFRACGVAYDNVLEAGMKPFVELSFMPRELAENPDQDGFIFYKPNPSMPKDVEAWKEYLKAFIRFLQHRYGEEEIRTWYFEVWNEPDLSSTFFTGGRDGYFRLYKASAEAIKEVDPLLRVGGPATSGSKWVRKFRQLCEEQGVPLDFLTTHQYAGDPIAGVEDSGSPESDGEENSDKSAFTPERLEAIQKMLQSVPEKTFLGGMRALLEDKSETTDIPKDMFLRNAKIVREQAEGYPLFYTEWGSNAIFSAATNDTRKTAAYIVKTALDVAPYMDGSSVWCFSDIFEEWHPFVEPFHGGFGLLNQDGIPKPGYHAMKMLADCGDERIDLGDGATAGEIGYAAFRSDNGMQLLLFRQNMKNNDAALKETATIRIEFAQQPITVTASFIDADHGNPMRVWQEDHGSRNDLNKAEIADIIEKSAVVPQKWNYSYSNGVIATEVSLGVNDICMIRID